MTPEPVHIAQDDGRRRRTGLTVLIALALGLAALTSCSSSSDDSVATGSSASGDQFVPGDDAPGSDDPDGGDPDTGLDSTAGGGDQPGSEVAPPNDTHGPAAAMPPDEYTPAGRSDSDDPDEPATRGPQQETRETPGGDPDTVASPETGTDSSTTTTTGKSGGSPGSGSSSGKDQIDPSAACDSPQSFRTKYCFGTWFATTRPIGPDILPQLEMILASRDGGQSQMIGQGSVEAMLSGQQAVTARGEGAYAHLFLQDVTGSGAQPLTTGPYVDGLAAAGPGGQSVAFVRAPALAQRANRGAPRHSRARSQAPVRGRAEDQNFDIYTVGMEGQDPVRLTDDPALDTQPSWSPAGDRIAFVSDRDGDLDIYLMDPDGTNVTRVTDNEDNDLFPTWSPDGRQISYASDRDGDFEIYVMGADGTGIRRLTKNDTDDLSPSWSPEGIAFSREKGEQNEIYVLDAEDVDEARQDPTVQKDRITTNEAEDMLPAWSPAGDVIAFTRLEQ